MKLTMDKYVALASIIKAAAPEKEKRPQPPQLRKREKAPDYVDYSKSLAAQLKPNPTAAGIRTATGTGALSALLAALASRLMSDNPWVVGGSALAGGTLGALSGFESGKNQALSDYSRLLFLRRLGVNRPGELEALRRLGAAGPRVIEEGAVI